MANLILEHVKCGDLPPDWAKRLDAAPDVTFTVAIVEETGSLAGRPAQRDSAPAPEDIPLFGIWKDNPASADVAGHVRSLRKSRF
jgi:hypothetical protein